MSGAEASTIVGLASGCLALIEAAIKVYKAVQDLHGLHPAFRVVYDRLPLVGKIIQQIENHYQDTPDDEEALKVMNSCHTSLEGLKHVFEKVLPGGKAGRYERYMSAIKGIKPGRAKAVERMMEDILKDLQLLQTHHVFEDLPDDELPKAIEAVSQIGPSIEEDNLAHNISADRGSVVPMGSGPTEVNQHWGKGDQWSHVGTVNFNKGKD
ncbi:hypothetical protein KCU71_g7095, partial [Aureobasidium melanogenum]